MLSNKNALVVMWTGNEVSDDLIKKIAEYLVDSGVTIPELLKIIYKDQDGIAQCMVREANGVQTIRFDVTTDELAEALKQAIIFIGKRFEASLTNARGNLVPFALELQQALSKARSAVGFNFLGVSNEDKALIKAVELIATTNAVIPKPLAQKYHITKQVCDIVRQIHNQFA